MKIRTINRIMGVVCILWFTLWVTIADTALYCMYLVIKHLA